MDTQPDVNELIKQTKRYEFLDGLRDLQLAIIILALGIVTWFVFDRADLWLRVVVDLKQSLGGFAGWVVVPVVLIPGLLGLLALPVMRHLRQRWLWRDSGMVRPKRGEVVPRRVTVAASVIAVAGVVVGTILQLLSPPESLILLRVLLVGSGWSLAYTLAAMARHLDLPRYVWAGLAGGLISTGLLFIPVTFGQTALIWGVAWCAVLIVSGAGRLHETARGVEDRA